MEVPVSLAKNTVVDLRVAHKMLNEARTAGDEASVETALLMIDEILDRRPRPIAVASDGEVVYDNSPSWVKAQVVVNAGPPERVFTAGELEALQREFRREQGLS